MDISQATDHNSRLLTGVGYYRRTLSLEFNNGRSFLVKLPRRSWRPIVAIALRDAPADLKRFMTKSISGKLGALARLPVCAETLSLLRLLQIIECLDLRMAARVAEGWIQLPLCDRAGGAFFHEDRRVVHVQLLGLSERPSSVAASLIPYQFHTFIKAANYTGLSRALGLYWRASDTFLGSTCIVFASPHGHQLEACLAISDCRVSYPPMAGGGLPEAHRAVQVLIDHIPTIIANDDARELAGWHPVGHEIMDIVDYLEDLKGRIGYAAQ